MGYCWIITKDHIDSDSVSTMGPREVAGATVGSPLLDLFYKSVNPTRFSLYDDDGECYYDGMLYGDFTGFEPLDDFGTPNAGCTKMKLAGEWL